MEILLYAAVLAVILVVVAIVAVLLYIKWQDWQRIRELKKYSIEELERTVYRYEGAYFKFIGKQNEPVREFRKLIENKDIFTLHKKWDSFQADFQDLERKAGHSGRPLIMDYYYGFELELRELYKRRRAEL